MKYSCEICGWVYDETARAPFSSLPRSFSCPVCGSEKDGFTPVIQPAKPQIPSAQRVTSTYVKYAGGAKESQR